MPVSALNILQRHASDRKGDASTLPGLGLEGRESLGDEGRVDAGEEVAGDSGSKGNNATGTLER